MPEKNILPENIPAEKRSVGRPKGTPNKVTAILKDALLQAAEDAGGKGGMVGYLTLQAHENPKAFLSILGKVLPMQVVGDENGGPVQFVIRDMTKGA